MTSPSRSANWELASESGTTLDSGLIDADGTFHACADADDLTSAELIFTASHQGLWEVLDDVDGDVHTFTTEVPDRATTQDDTDLGELEVPEDAAGAFKIVDVLTDLYDLRATDSPCWTAHQTTAKDCSTLTFVWSTDRDDGGYFDLGESDAILLTGEDAASTHVVLHEAGHWWQWQLYGEEFPEVTNCDPHYIDQATSPTCAWTEGFADAVAAWTLGDREFVHSDGTVQAMEPDDETPFDAGADVQGNVGAALLDLWELDGPDGTWDANIHLMTDEFSEDFDDYFTNARPAAGLPTDGAALDIVTEHTVA